MISVLVVDDHAIVRAGLRLILDAEPGMEVVGEAADGEQAVLAATAQRPDVVLLDLQMPGMTGIETLPGLLEAQPGVRVVILSMEGAPQLVQAAFAAGAHGYVLKEAADTEVVEAVRAVAGGEQYVAPALGARLIAGELAEQRRADADPLSGRERQVFRLLALGYTNQEVAAKLFVSVRTVEGTRGHILQKLGLSSRADLVRYALQHGLLDLEE